MTRKRSHPLTDEDLEVWRRVARTATPLKPTGTLAQPGKSPPPAQPPRSAETPAPATSLPKFQIGEAARYDHSKGHDLSHTLEARLAAQPVRMDQKAFARLKKGKLRPERTLDLHGMTLAQAHPALTRFLLDAHGAGLRLVVIVTGKGKVRDEDGPIPVPRGVLRHQVPMWLSAPPLSQIVLQVSAAHLRHGGSGAYYVYLARRR